MLRPHGVRGALKVGRYLPGADTLLRVARVRIAGVERRVRAARAHGPAVLLEVEGVDALAQAEALRDAEVEVLRADLGPDTAGEVYAADLIGCEARDRDGRPLGVVRGVRDYGAGDLLVLDAAGAERLVPLRDGTVAGYWPRERVVVLDLPDGLP